VLTLEIRQALAGQLSAKGIRSGKNLEAVVIEMLEAGAKRWRSLQTERSSCSSGCVNSCWSPVRSPSSLEAGPSEPEPPAEAAERIAYGILVAALEEGLVTTLQHAMDVLKRFSAPAGPLGEEWLSDQERRLGQ
jgi:hypothetical protein